MGTIISSITKGVEGIAQEIASSVNDVKTCIKQVEDITASFTSGAAETSDGLQGAIKSAMKGAKAKAEEKFKSKFSGTSAAGAQNGGIKNFCDPTGGNPPHLVKQLKTTFIDWKIPVTSGVINEMSQTIVTNVNAQLGIGSTAQGSYALNENQNIVWVVAYGMFVMTENGENGLVYAFTAGLQSSF